MSVNNLPAAWTEVEQLDGLELVDKEELVKVPFRITQVWFQMNAQNQQTVYVDGERADGTEFTFNDSGSGVRTQILQYLQKLEKDYIVDSGETLPISLVIPNGLRKSEYDTPDKRTGKIVRARTFYLTTNGQRASKPAPAKAAKKAA